MKTTLYVCFLLVSIFGLTAYADYAILWHTVNGGGSVQQTGGDFTISGTFGQTDASAGWPAAPYKLTGGFWFGVSAVLYDLDYLVNGDGLGNGSGKYWPTPDVSTIDDGYFDARFVPAVALSGQDIYPGWCADNDTYIKLGRWYENVSCYSSLNFSNTCAQFVNIGILTTCHP